MPFPVTNYNGSAIYSFPIGFKCLCLHQARAMDVMGLIWTFFKFVDLKPGYLIGIRNDKIKTI